MPGLEIETWGIQLRWIGMWATRLSPERLAAKRRASVQLRCRWSGSTPVRMIFYCTLDNMRLPVNWKTAGSSTQFSPCKSHVAAIRN